jgi:hypothetical protein
MVGRAATNPEPLLASVSTLPAFERLAEPASAAEFVAAIEACTKPGEVVLDLNGRGGWVARAAIAEQRRAADFEMWPLTRLLADVVLRPPDLRQIESATTAVGGTALSGSTVRRTIEAMYAAACATCGRPVTLESMVWQPIASPLGPDGGPAAKKASRSRGKSPPTAPGSALLPSLRSGPEELLRPVAREYRCAYCFAKEGGPEVRTAEPSLGDVKLAESIPASGEVRELMRRRFPAPRPTHPLVDQLLDLHTARQLLGLRAILTAIDAEDRPGAINAALRVALLHAVLLASRLNVGRSKTAMLRITNGALKVPEAREWRELNPWAAFEGGLTLVKAFAHSLESGTPRSALARLGADIDALEGTTANVTVGEATPGSLRKLGLHGERMSHSGSSSRVRLVLGQAPLRWTPERLAASYHGTGWVFGAAAASLLPYDELYRPAPRTTPTDEWMELARSLGRTLAVASPVLSQTGRAVIFLDDAEPTTLVAAALGGAAAGSRLVDARLHRGDDDSAGVAIFVPGTGVMAPGPRTRANRPLPPVAGGAGDPGTVRGHGMFAAPERLDEGPFRTAVAGQAVTEAAVELLKARGEPATFEHMLGDLLIGIDESGQLARLARVLQPPGARDGWSAWVEAFTVGPTGATPGAEAKAGAEATAGETAWATSGSDLGDGGRAAKLILGADEASPLDPVSQLLDIIHAELDRPNNRRIRQIEPGQYWLASDEDLSVAAQPLADRVEWAVFSLMSSGGHLTERAAIERTEAMFKGHDAPDGTLVEACLASYAAAHSTAESVFGFEQLEGRTVEHDRVIAMLADLGHRLGTHVWIGKRQQARRVDGQALSTWLDQAEREVHLPLITWAPDGELDRVDCAWYVRRKATFLFEVEWTAMLTEPVLKHHARYPIDDKVVRFLVIAPERAELVKVKLARSPLLRKAIAERNWHFIKWNHLAEFAARPEVSLDDLEPYLGLDAVADKIGEQLPLFGGR